DTCLRNRHAATYSQVRPAGNLGSVSVQRQRASYAMPSKYLFAQLFTVGPVRRRPAWPSPSQFWPTGTLRERRGGGLLSGLTRTIAAQPVLCDYPPARSKR